MISPGTGPPSAGSGATSAISSRGCPTPLRRSLLLLLSCFTGNVSAGSCGVARHVAERGCQSRWSQWGWVENPATTGMPSHSTSSASWSARSHRCRDRSGSTHPRRAPRWNWSRPTRSAGPRRRRPPDLACPSPLHRLVTVLRRDPQPNSSLSAAAGCDAYRGGYRNAAPGEWRGRRSRDHAGPLLSQERRARSRPAPRMHQGGRRLQRLDNMDGNWSLTEGYFDSPAASRASSRSEYMSMRVCLPSRNVQTCAKDISTGVPAAFERPRWRTKTTTLSPAS